ncbi:MAG TPA: phosphotransferase [Symbiobacteriaceae bacterium]|nr:phosphotransferase [Symbiobacteriaceae bacterium]
MQLQDYVVQNAARRLLANPAATLEGWTCSQTGFTPVNPATGGIYRVQGTVAGRPWSMLTKVPQISENSPDDETHWNYWKREVLFYQSGLDQLLPAGTRAPGFGGTAADSNGQLVFFMEDVPNCTTEPWPVSWHATLARCLAQFNASPAPTPALPWLCTGWLRGVMRIGLAGLQMADKYQVWELLPAVRAAFPPELVGRIHRLAAESPRLLGELDAMPTGMMHTDTHQGNVMTVLTATGEPEFVLIDWTSVGPGAMGEEIGHQFGANVTAGHVPLSQAAEVKEAIIAGYLSGLEQTDEAQVRRAFIITAALRGVLFNLMLPMPTLATAPVPVASEIAERLGRAADMLLADAGF